MNGSDLVELEEQGKQYEDLFDVERDEPSISEEREILEALEIGGIIPCQFVKKEPYVRYAYLEAAMSLLQEAEKKGAKKMAEAVKGDQSPINNAGDPETLRYEQIWTMRVDKALDQTLTRIMDNPHNKE